MFSVISRCQKHSNNLFISRGSIQIPSGGQKLICLQCVAVRLHPLVSSSLLSEQQGWENSGWDLREHQKFWRPLYLQPKCQGPNSNSSAWSTERLGRLLVGIWRLTAQLCFHAIRGTNTKASSQRWRLINNVCLDYNRSWVWKLQPPPARHLHINHQIMIKISPLKFKLILYSTQCLTPTTHQ